LHVQGPLALAKACVDAGIRRFVQVSALGVPEDGRFIASKHAFDDALLALPLDAVVLRPSVVYAAAGSYGGTSLLRALAAFPGAQWLPGDGRWPIQPVAAEDLAELVVAAAGGDATGMFEVGGPSPMPLADYQAAWRRWLRIPGVRRVHVPISFVALQVWLWERLGSGPIGETMWRMLQRGNTTHEGAHARLHGQFGIAPRSLDEVLARYPAVRPAGVHCFEWYSGELYRRFHEEPGIYFLTDWLVQNWERAVIRGLGLDRFPWMRERYFGNLERVLFVRQHPDAAREEKAREIAAYMDKPLEIHDLGIGPLEDLLVPLMEPEGEGNADAVRS